MRDVLQSTARKFKIYMADSSAPTTAKTGLSSFTVYLSKDGLAESTVAPSITERGHGWYEVTPLSAHRDTLGENAWTFAASGAIDFVMKETVIAIDQQVATQPVNVTQFGGTNGTFNSGIPTAALDPAARVKLDATQPDYAPSTAAALAAVDAKIGTPETSLSAMVGNVPTVAELEARTILAANYRQNITIRGTSMTEAKAFDLLLASLAGVTSQPSGTTEKFKFLDGNDAFTTTFDTNGNRTGVSLA